MELKTVIFLGRSGCGKGTQSDLLIKYLQEKDLEHPVLYVSMGSEMRKFWQENTYSAKLSKEWVERGDLQPAFVPIYTWSKFLIEQAKGNEHWIFDGAPRRMNESQILGSALKFYHRKKPKIILLEISEDTAIERLLKRGREDDSNVEEIKERLAWYERDTMPVIHSIRTRADFELITIDGERPIDEIHTSVVAALFAKE